MQTPDRLMPQNIEAEESVLSACLIDPSAMLDAVDLLKPSHFYRTHNSKIFQAMVELHQDRKPVDLVMVADKLRAKGELDAVGGATHLQKIIDTVPMAVNVEHYCNIVKGCAVMRDLITQCNAIQKAAFDSYDTPLNILMAAQKRITEIDFDTKDNVRPFRDLVIESQDRYESSYKNQVKVTGIPSGYHFLDHLTCGWQPSNLIVVAGRPSMGKSALAWCLADHAAKYGHVTLIFSLEMACEEYTDRAFAKYAQVNTQKFRSGKFEPEDWDRITDAGSELYQRKVWIDDTPAVDYNYIRRISRVYKQRHDVSMVIIDHLQLMKGDKSSTRDREIASITIALKALAKELKIPVILLSQLNRSLEQRPVDDRRPRLSDLRDSGNIEQDADLVLFLYRDAVYNSDLPKEKVNIAELDLKKQRNGPTGRVSLYWNDRITTFFDLATQQEG